MTKLTVLVAILPTSPQPSSDPVYHTRSVNKPHVLFHSEERGGSVVTGQQLAKQWPPQIASRVKGRDTPKILAKVTPRSRILLEDLTGPQPVKKLSPFYGNRRFIIAFVKAHHSSEP